MVSDQRDLNLWPIGNCQVSALIDNDAGFIWGCTPRGDGDPNFCALLRNAAPSDIELGVWRISIAEQVSATPRYNRNTPILTTRLESADGNILDVIDFCPRFGRMGRIYRPVAYARILRPVRGKPRVRINLSPMSNYGETLASVTSGMLEHYTASGLLSEDMDFTTGELWGNFPQTYSLVGIIHCAGLLSKGWVTVS